MIGSPTIYGVDLAKREDGYPVGSCVKLLAPNNKGGVTDLGIVVRIKQAPERYDLNTNIDPTGETVTEAHNSVYGHVVDIVEIPDNVRALLPVDGICIAALHLCRPIPGEVYR